MTRRAALILLLTVAAVLGGGPHGLRAQSPPAGEVVIAFPVTIAPTWFDPAETPAQITPFAFLYALHDGLVRPLPGARMGNSLATAWTESPDGLVYTFTLRPGLRFHNGAPCTAEDVQFSFERYKGNGATELHTKVQRVEVVDPLTVRFHLHAPWPDFMTYYGTTATAAGLVVPKHYLQQVGEDGFKHHPIGLGPYKFIRHVPGVELVLEAYEGYWRHMPHVKRVIFKGVPEDTTRLAMLKKGEADIAIAFLDGAVAQEAQRDPQLTLVATQNPSLVWVEFADQWDPHSPWHDRRVRLAANYALDRQAINDAACLGYCTPTGVLVPRVMDLALPVEPLPYDPAKAKQLLAEAGYPHGFEAGDLVPIPPAFTLGEAVVNDLNAVGIRVTMRPMERAPFYAAWREKKLRGLFMTGAGPSGNAATRIEAFIYSKGAYAYGGYPDIDALFQAQAIERDRAKREALLHRIQQLTVERVMFAPLLDFRTLHGIGPRVAEHTINAIPLYPFPAYEDLQLKAP